MSMASISHGLSVRLSLRCERSAGASEVQVHVNGKVRAKCRCAFEIQRGDYDTPQSNIIAV